MAEKGTTWSIRCFHVATNDQNRRLFDRSWQHQVADLEWEIAMPKNKYTVVNKRKRPSSAPATKLDYTHKTSSIEDWSKELGSPGFKTTDLSKLKNLHYHGETCLREI